MKKSIKSVALLLLCTALLAACSSNGNSPSGSSQGAASPEASKEVTHTYSILYNDNPSYPFNKDWPVIKKMQEINHIKLDFQAVPTSDYMNKAKIVLSSGSIPDMVTSVNQSIIMEFAPSGILLPISDYFDKLPNLKKKIDEYNVEEDLENWRPADGKLYFLPFMNEARLYNRAPLIRTDLLEKYGLTAPTNVDELYNVLKVMKEKDPSSYPLANADGSNSLISIVGAAWGIGPTYNGFMYNKESNSFEYAYTSENYKQYLSYLHRLMDEGLADPELFTSSLDQWKQKLATGKSTMTFYWISEVAQLNADGKKNVSPDFNLAPLPPIAGPGGMKAYSANRVQQGNIIPASIVDKPYFEDFLKFVDWLYSDEGNELMTWGIEGETFTESNGEKDFTDAVKNAPSINKAFWEIGAANNSYTMLFPANWFVKVLNVKELEEFTEKALANNWFPPVAKAPKLTANQLDEEKLAVANVKDFYAKAQEQFVYGRLNLDKDWDRYVKDINSKGVTKLLELYNASLKK